MKRRVVGMEYVPVSSVVRDARVQRQRTPDHSSLHAQDKDLQSQSLNEKASNSPRVPKTYHVTPSGRVAGLDPTTSAGAVWRTGTGSEERSRTARREAELIHARSLITQLEVEVLDLQRAAKRAKVEEEEERGGVSNSRTSLELERLHTLDRERRRLAEEVAEARALLEGRESEVEEVKVRLEVAVAAQEREGREHKTEVDELRSEVSSLTNQVSFLSSQLSLARREGELVKEGLERERSTYSLSVQSLSQRVRELEREKARREGAEERVKDLEHRLKRQMHNVHFAEAVESRLLRYEDMEVELRRTKEENETLQTHTSNTELLQYQLQTAREQLKQYRDMERRVAQLEEEKRAQGRSAEREGERDSLTRSSPAMQRKVSELQQSQIILLSQARELESKLKLAQRAASQAETAAMETKKQLTKEQEECRQREERIQRLEKRLLFVTKERDGCVNVLKSYRLDSGVNALLKENISEVEQQLTAAKGRIAELEEELEAKAPSRSP